MIVTYPVWTELVNNWKEFLNPNISISEQWRYPKYDKIRKFEVWKIDKLTASEAKSIAFQLLKAK